MDAPSQWCIMDGGFEGAPGHTGAVVVVVVVEEVDITSVVHDILL
jgi:hypothetical protein